MTDASLALLECSPAINFDLALAFGLSLGRLGLGGEKREREREKERERSWVEAIAGPPASLDRAKRGRVKKVFLFYCLKRTKC
jgi:hypothetical protein